MNRIALIFLLGTSAFSLFAGCNEDEPHEPEVEVADTVSTQPLVISDLVAVENPANALSFFVSWTTSEPTATELAVDCGEDYQHTFTDEAARWEHEVFVMGLMEGLSCTFDVILENETTGETQTTAVVSPVPDLLPELTVNVLDTGRMQPGWTLFSVSAASHEGEMTVVAIDEQGRYRWYFKPGWAKYGSGAEIEVIDEGIMIGNAAPHAQIVNWESSTVWKLGPAAHHDMRISPFNDNHVLYLSSSSEGCDTAEHTVNELDRATDEVIWQWRVCDHWTPRLAYRNWSHLNTIEPVPGERAMLISSRDQDLIFKVDRDTGEVAWTLGRDGDFAMDAADWFYRQHAPEVLDDGTIMVFDNGVAEREAGRTGLPADEFREYSRVVVYELTFDADGNPDRANVVWEYTDESVFAVNRSEADRLANGNTLIHYVWVAPNQSLILREVTPEKETVWEVVTPPDVASYRSERVEPYFGHVRGEL